MIFFQTGIGARKPGISHSMLASQPQRDQRKRFRIVLIRIASSGTGRLEVHQINFGRRFNFICQQTSVKRKPEEKWNLGHVARERRNIMMTQPAYIVQFVRFVDRLRNSGDSNLTGSTENGFQRGRSPGEEVRAAFAICRDQVVPFHSGRKFRSIFRSRFRRPFERGPSISLRVMAPGEVRIPWHALAVPS